MATDRVAARSARRRDPPESSDYTVDHRSGTPPIPSLSSFSTRTSSSTPPKMDTDVLDTHAAGIALQSQLFDTSEQELSNGFMNPSFAQAYYRAVDGITLPNETSFLEYPDPPDPQLQREASLLMVYLDYAFPHHFPFYHPALEHGGRTWLLPLLTSTKPVYYASLALGALRWRQRLGEHGAREFRDLLRQDEERHFLIALHELRLYVKQAMTLESCLGALACIMQLTIYEAKVRRIGSWRVHLDAAAMLIGTAAESLKQQACAPNDSLFGQILSPVSLNEASLVAEQSTSAIAEPLRFVVGALLWFHALSGTSHVSQSLPCEQKALFVPSQVIIRLENIVGCKNWVMLGLVDALALSRWVHDQRNKGCLSVRELARRAQEIEDKLERHMREELSSASSFRERLRYFDGAADSIPRTPSEPPGSIDAATPERRAILCISYVFALATLTWTHVTVEGLNPDLREVRANVRRTLNALEAIHPQDMELVMPRLIWPLVVTSFVIGESEEERSSITRLVNLALKDGTTPGGARSPAASTVTQLIEAVWHRRAELRGLSTFDLGQAIDMLGLPVLLI